MDVTLLERTDPVAAYRGLCVALHADHGWASDRHWLRFAAQAASLRPGASTDTARDIHAFLEELRRKCGWNDSLQLPFGQMIAAAMVQVGDTPEAFIADLHAARKLMHSLGLPHSNWYELKAIAALRLMWEGGTVASEPLLNRVAEIYAGLRNYHWWTTGRHELPACALLSGCPGDPPAIIGNAEAVASAVAAEHLVHGHALQTVAGILPLAGLPAGAAFRRLEALVAAISAAGLPKSDETVTVAAMLCLLDHEPAVIAARLHDLANQLADADHPTFITADIAVAADLAFLDLLRCDAQGHRLSTVVDDLRMRRLLRLQRAISVVIADVPVEPATSDWPLMPFA